MVAPKLRFKEFDGDWDLKNLGDCFSLFSGYAFPSSASVDNGTKWLKIADVGIQEMTPNKLSFLPNNFTTKFPQFIVSKNDYVIALTRPILNKKLKIAKVGEFYDGALLNQRVAKIVSENNNLDFIYSLLQKSKTVEELENSIAGTDPPNLSLNEVKGIVLGIPKVEEQTKIASFLSNVDEKISQLTQKHELLSQYKQGMMQKLFSQQIRFKADDGSEFGEWEEKLLSEIGAFKNGLNKDKESFGFGSPFINLMDVFGKKVVQTDNLGLVEANQKDLENYDLKKGDVLFIRSSVKAEGVGQTALVIDDLPNTVYSGFLIRFRDNYGLDLGFKKYCFMNNDFRLRLLAKSTTSANTNINQESLSALTLNIPCLEEQTKIANFLSSIDQKIEVVVQQIEQAKMWKKGLLQQMFV